MNDQSKPSKAETTRAKVNELLRQLAPLGSKPAAFDALAELMKRAEDERNGEAAGIILLANTWLSRPDSRFP